MLLQHALFGLMVLFHGGAGRPANDDPYEDLEYGGPEEDDAEVDVGSLLDSMEEVESITPVKSIQEVKSIKEVKHITPIEEKVALDAIKKFRLHNQLGNGDVEEEVDEEVLEAEEEIFQREEEIKESLEKEHDLDEMVKERISAMKTVRGKHKKHAHELEMEMEELEEMEEVISAGGRAESSEGSFDDLDEMEEVEKMEAIKSLKEIKSMKHIKNIQEVKSIEPVKSIQEVKHIYELTPTQARELKKLVGLAESDDDSDYIVSARHGGDDYVMAPQLG